MRETGAFSGLGLHLGTLARLSDAETRSISPENFTGAKGGGGRSTDGPAAEAARDLGQGWKVSPYIVIEPGATFTLADIAGSGAIQQIWMTLARGKWRHSILRAYWDDQEHPSIECPTGDFFACGWERYAQVSSLAVCVNPGRAFNCYWEMPFRKRARFTMTNLSDEALTVYYQINYTLTAVPDDLAYFHAQFRRVNPLPYKSVYTLLEGVSGRGHYVGTYMAWGVNNNGWWGEGEIKFYLDGDDAFPTLCGTGTEDYFCGAYNFDPGLIERDREGGSRYQEFTTPYAGMPQVIRPDGVYQAQQRFGLYRWHIMDPVRFQSELRVTIQALGWRTHRRRQYLPLQDDIASVAYWYQTLPTARFPVLPDRDALEVI
ncbi:MAG: glycoside hydrolase family 172 protein [Gammaproteobacteria bacterium]